MIEKPELPLGGIQAFDLDVERGDAWPMPEVKPWAPVELSPEHQQMVDLMEESRAHIERVLSVHQPVPAAPPAPNKNKSVWAMAMNRLRFFR